MASTIAKSGEIGEMRREFFPYRFEPTTFPVDPDDIDILQRSALTDQRPEKPLFEWEYPRNSNTATSDCIINLRTAGKRWLEFPDQPDLNLSDFERDPRGTQIGPDWYKFADDQRVRMGYYAKRFTDDSMKGCNSGVIEPQRMANLKRSGRDDLKDRLVFEDSYGNFIPANGGTYNLEYAPHRNRVNTKLQADIGPGNASFAQGVNKEVKFSNIFETRKQLQTDHLLPQTYMDAIPRTMKDVGDLSNRHLITLDHSREGLLEVVLKASKIPFANPYDLAESRRNVEIDAESLFSGDHIKGRELKNIIKGFKLTPIDSYVLTNLMDLTENDSRFRNSKSTVTKFWGVPDTDTRLKYIAELTAKEDPRVRLEMKIKLRDLIRHSSLPASLSERRLLIEEGLVEVNPEFREYMGYVAKFGTKKMRDNYKGIPEKYKIKSAEKFTQNKKMPEKRIVNRRDGLKSDKKVKDQFSNTGKKLGVKNRNNFHNNVVNTRKSALTGKYNHSNATFKSKKSGIDTYHIENRFDDVI